MLALRNLLRRRGFHQDVIGDDTKMLFALQAHLLEYKGGGGDADNNAEPLNVLEPFISLVKAPTS